MASTSAPIPPPSNRPRASPLRPGAPRRAWFLVNGASQGNLAAGLALAHRGQDVVIQRNAHSSTIDSLVLSGMRPTFAAPGDRRRARHRPLSQPETLERALSQTPRAVAAWVISPTYFGAVADIAALAEVAHARGVPLVVDEAWGAHMAFHEDCRSTPSPPVRTSSSRAPTRSSAA